MTKDGIDVFLRDSTWILHKNTWTLASKPTMHNNENWCKPVESAHWNFSTRDAALEFIIMNKPMKISINQIADIYSTANTRSQNRSSGIDGWCKQAYALRKLSIKQINQDGLL